MKNSFILFAEYEEKLAMLSDEQFGRLMRAIFQRETTGKVSIELDAMSQMALGFISGDLDRARRKYESSIENGKKGGRPRKSESKENPDKTQENLKEPEANLDVDVDVDVDVVKNIVRHLNMRLGASYKADSKSTVREIKARLSEGFVFDDFVQVIDKKHKEWHARADMAVFLRPQTLFGTKFEGYLNQPTPTAAVRSRGKQRNYQGRKWDYDHLAQLEQAHISKIIGEADVS